MAITVSIGCAVIISYQFSTKKAENAEKNFGNGKYNMKEAKHDIYKDKKDSIADYQEFKEEAEKRILVYETEIADLKLKLKNEKTENNVEIEEKLADLEYKNRFLKKILKDYYEIDIYKWEIFKGAFSNELDNVGISINKLTDNTIQSVNIK